MRRLSPAQEKALREMRDCFHVAWSNISQNRRRLMVAVTGTSVAILLLILQMAFLAGVRYEATRLYEYFDFDVALIPQSYQFLRASGEFDTVRLLQAKAAEKNVTEIFSLNIDGSRWINTEDGKASSALIIGIDEIPDMIDDWDLREGLSLLKGGRAILIDRFSGSDYGDIDVGKSGIVGGAPVDIVGQFELGLFFYAEGSVAVKNTDFGALSGRDERSTNIGLLKLKSFSSAARAKENLQKALPDDVRVLTRSELIQLEQDFFVTAKPIGLMLRISMFIAFLVGSTILFQVLSTEVSNRIKEFATLKAMGFTPRFIIGIGLFEALLLAGAALTPAFVLGFVILWLVEAITHLPAGINFRLTLEIILIVLAMSLFSSVSALRRIGKADPAELYA